MTNNGLAQEPMLHGKKKYILGRAFLVSFNNILSFSDLCPGEEEKIFTI